MNPAELLTIQIAHPMALHLYCAKLFGPQYLAWEPETIWSELQTITGVAPSHLNRTKINACRTIHIADTVFTDWLTFEKVINALNSIPIMFDTMQKPSPSALAHGVWIILKLRTQPFSPEVQKYMLGVLLDAGICFPPDELLFLRDEIKSQVPQEIFNTMERLQGENLMSLPSDSTIAYQVLTLRGIADYVSLQKRIYNEQLPTAK